jgi:hypothetical protein
VVLFLFHAQCVLVAGVPIKCNNEKCLQLTTEYDDGVFSVVEDVLTFFLCCAYFILLCLV